MSETVAQVTEEQQEQVQEAPAQRQRTESEDSNPENASPEIDFKPIVSLPLVEIKSLEEEEQELLKIRAKLYRYETSEDPPEWKERGLGDVKFLQNLETSAVRILMRREKTLKICANHNVTPAMNLSQHANNDKAFVWSTIGDFSEGEARPETFCIRFGSIENAQKFKKAFDEAKATAASIKNLYDSIKNMGLDDDSTSDDESSAEEAEREQSTAEDDVAAGEKPDTSAKENEKPEADQVAGTA